jgi:hypothetical protein
MVDADRQIGFEQLGIGSVLRSFWLQVPLHQREYSWTEREVTALFHDINKAILDEAPEYFLGSVVTIPKEGQVLEVVDGQQRLATTAILLAAIRNYLRGRKEDELIVQDIETGFLTAVNRSAREQMPRLRLNVQDGHYFQQRILGDDNNTAATAHSHRLIDAAARLAERHVRDIVRPHDPKNHGDALNRWINYLEHRAIVVLLKVPSEVNAYKMFETLNDRGLRTSQSDLVKNYLFGQAGNRLSEAQQKWAGMRAVLESFEDDDITIHYLRQMLISLYGYMREGDVYETVASRAKGVSQSIAFLATLEAGAGDYAAIVNPEHEKWNGYPPSVRRAIATLGLLKMRAMRPVLLSVARKFSPQETDKALRLILNLSVRIMIAGGASSAARSGAVEEALARVAQDISDGKIGIAADLLKAFDPVAPKDPQFQEAFATASVSQAHLARYYLRSLEMAAASHAQPYYLPNDDAQAINLEHVLPRAPGSNWPQFSPEEAEAFHRRLGNMVLLQAKPNSDLKSTSFAEKAKVYAAAPYKLTNEVGRRSTWTPAEIAARQKDMAEVAVRAWPLTAD